MWKKCCAIVWRASNPPPGRSQSRKFSRKQGGQPQPVPGLAETDVLAQWSADGRSVLVYRWSEIPCRLERVELSTGYRTLFKEFAPPDRTGLLSMREIFVTDDLQSYAYTAYYQVSSLFVSEAKQ